MLNLLSTGTTLSLIVRLVGFLDCRLWILLSYGTWGRVAWWITDVRPALIFDLEDGCSTFLQIVRTLISDNTELHPTRQYTSFVAISDPNIVQILEEELHSPDTNWSNTDFRTFNADRFISNSIKIWAVFKDMKYEDTWTNRYNLLHVRWRTGKEFLTSRQTLKVRKRMSAWDNGTKCIFALQWTLSCLTGRTVLQLACGLHPCVKELFAVRGGVVF